MKHGSGIVIRTDLSYSVSSSCSHISVDADSHESTGQKKKKKNKKCHSSSLAYRNVEDTGLKIMSAGVNSK